MASLGSITMHFVDTGQMREVNPPWLPDQDAWRKLDRSGTISGNIAVTGTPESNSVVRMYYRPDGQLMYGERSDAAGNYSFSVLDRSSTDYYVIAITDSAFNALVFDKLAPV